MADFLIDEELLAAIDMGSNSFHLAIARVDVLTTRDECKPTFHGKSSGR